MKEHHENIFSYTERIMQMIGNDQMKLAIQEAQKLLKGTPLFYELTLQSARYSEIVKSIRMGTLDYDNAAVEKNKLRYALMNMLQELEESVKDHLDINNEVQTYLKENKPITRNIATTIMGDKNFNVQVVSGSEINIQVKNHKKHNKEKKGRNS